MPGAAPAASPLRSESGISVEASVESSAVSLGYSPQRGASLSRWLAEDAAALLDAAAGAAAAAAAEEARAEAAVAVPTAVNLNDFQLKHLPWHGLAALPTLTSLSIAGNHFADPDLLGAQLSQLGCLVELDISRCRLQSMPPLDGLQQLSSLDASYNLISSSAGLLQCAALCRVSLARNQLRLVEEMGALQQLEELDLSYNRLSLPVHVSLRALGACTTLRVLHVIGNPLAASPAHRAQLADLIPSLGMIDGRRLQPLRTVGSVKPPLIGYGALAAMKRDRSTRAFKRSCSANSSFASTRSNQKVSLNCSKSDVPGHKECPFANSRRRSNSTGSLPTKTSANSGSRSTISLPSESTIEHSQSMEHSFLSDGDSLLKKGTCYADAAARIVLPRQCRPRSAPPRPTSVTASSEFRHRSPPSLKVGACVGQRSPPSSSIAACAGAGDKAGDKAGGIAVAHCPAQDHSRIEVSELSAFASAFANATLDELLEEKRRLLESVREKLEKATAKASTTGTHRAPNGGAGPLVLPESSQAELPLMPDGHVPIGPARPVMPYLATEGTLQRRSRHGGPTPKFGLGHGDAANAFAESQSVAAEGARADLGDELKSLSQSLRAGLQRKRAMLMQLQQCV